MSQEVAYTQEYREQGIPCLICKEPLIMKLTRGRKSGKPFVMLVCGRDGRHFRAFVNDQEYVSKVLERLERKSSIHSAHTESST